jgi:2,4-dienoyl-CoA reductase-like NADH-dependent reductase (Old Yellow Enzyme family)/NADPH-dependent 2,4-dienoyl-CoA reductase/sulfur reductase-like enzyme
LKHLLEPLIVKGMELRNRVVMPPMVTNFASEEGAVTKQTIDYYRERAKGGAALIIVEMSYVHPSGKAFPCMLGVYNDKSLPGLNELAEAIKSYGACAALQIGHAGRQTGLEISGHQILAPSAIPLKGTAEVPKEMSIEEIQEIVHAFGAATLRAKRAGFDAVELHGTHGYLLNQFLSPYTNKRTDAYGGSFENRLRCPIEVIQEVRSKVGEDYPLIFRLCANEYIEGDAGITLDLAKEIAPRLVEAGIDMLHVTGGIGDTRDHLVQPLYYNQGYHVYLAEGIKQVVDIVPVITAGSITDPYLADKILEEEKADLIAVGRGLIADPMFLNKTKEDRVKEIRRCIRCNECVGRLRSGCRISCTVNPVVGKEPYSELSPVRKPKKVLVAGAGPAGMEAARILSLRGHEVTLCEKSDAPGGLLRISSVPRWKKDILALVDWLKSQLEQSDVAINLNTEVTTEYITKFNPDVLIVSTGSTPYKPDIPGIESAIAATDVLKGVVVGDKVIICGGGLVGCEVAWYLAELNKKVALVEMLDEIGMDMETSSRTVILRKLHEHNVEVICNLKVEKIIPEEGIIGIDKTWSRREIKGDTVVLAMGFDPNRTLFDIKDKSYEVYLIGDAKEPRRIIDAIREANHIARFEI